MTIAEIENCFLYGEGEHKRIFGSISTDILKEITQVFTAEPNLKNNCFEVSRIGDVEGYQRRAMPSRQNLFGRYVTEHEGEFVSPPVLLNARGEWEFVPSNENKNVGKIIIKDRANIIDGQHRIGGFIYAYKKNEKKVKADFVAFLNISLEKENEIFDTINTTQKGVPPSLSVRNRQEIQENRVVKMLAENSSSPFVGRISMTGTMLPEVKFQAAQFAKNIKRTFDDGAFKESKLSDEEMFDILCECWNLIAKTYPDQWEIDKPKKDMDYKLLELTGLIAWSLVFQKRLGQYFNADERTIDFTALEKAISRAKDVDWSKDGDFEGLTGEVGGRQISNKISFEMQSSK